MHINVGYSSKEPLTDEAGGGLSHQPLPERLLQEVAHEQVNVVGVVVNCG